MKDTPYQQLEDVIADDMFPIVDNELRYGKHIDSSEYDKHEFISYTFNFLEEFYHRCGYKLKKSTTGNYYFLLPRVDNKLTFSRSTRTLSEADMLLGHALAALSLETHNLLNGYITTLDDVYKFLETTMPKDRLYKILVSDKSSRNEQAIDNSIRKELNRALKVLHRLGFIQQRTIKKDISGGPRVEILLKESLMRFVEPVKDSADPVEVLTRLVRDGEVVYEWSEKSENNGVNEGLATDKVYSENPLSDERNEEE